MKHSYIKLFTFKWFHEQSNRKVKIVRLLICSISILNVDGFAKINTMIVWLSNKTYQYSIFNIQLSTLEYINI